MPTGVYEHKSRPLIQRFCEKVEVSDQCWRWLGSLNEDGYGHIRVDGDIIRAGAHRASWLLFSGPIPEGLSVLHHCDNPACVRPDHLYLGTQKENMRDALVRRRLEVFRDPEKVKARLDAVRHLSCIGTCRGEKHHSAKLTEDDVRTIKTLFATMNDCQIARRYGVHSNAIWKIRTGRSWRHI